MLTLFTTCKPFTGTTAVAQRNAIASWLRLGHGCEVVLIGDDEGTAEVAREFGIRHVPDVRRNEYGTPLLDSVFDMAQAVAPHDVLCYLNADIMLMGDFFDAVSRLDPERVLMISRRWNVDVEGAWDFDPPDWQDRLRAHVLACGKQKSELGGPDFFVFRRGQFKHIPPFALGRTAFDNWLIYEACRLGYPVIDASSCVMAIHQNHDCAHAEGGWTGAWFGEEAVRNRALATDGSGFYNFLDSTHLMTPEGPVPAMSAAHMARRVEKHLARWFDDRLFYAASLHELGRHEDALSVIKETGQACTRPARTLRYARALLRALYVLGREKEAKKFICTFLAVESSPLSGYHLASMCEELGALDTATALFRAVLGDDSYEGSKIKSGAHFHLGRIAASTGDVQRARQHAEACLAQTPDHAAARTLLDGLATDVSVATRQLAEALPAHTAP